MKFTWLWSGLYKGLEIAWRYDTSRQRGIFIGWHSPYWKKRGW